jgi:hypothetical protein
MLRLRRGHGRGREGGGTVSVKLQTIDWSCWLLSQSANADIEIQNSLKKKRRRRRRGQRVAKDLRTGVEDVVHMYLRVAPDTQRSLQAVRRHFLQWSNDSDFEHGLAGLGENSENFVTLQTHGRQGWPWTALFSERRSYHGDPPRLVGEASASAGLLQIKFR